MIPEKHRREKRFKKNLSQIYAFVSRLILFLTGFLLLGPVIHETGHLIILEIFNCSRQVFYGFNSLTGFRGTFILNCSLNEFQQAVFYLSGYFSTFLLGLGTLLISRRIKRYRKPVIAAGIGILTSIFSSITLKGDIHSLDLGVEGLNTFLTVFMIVLISSLSLIFLDSEYQNGRKGTETIP